MNSGFFNERYDYFSQRYQISKKEVEDALEYPSEVFWLSERKFLVSKFFHPDEKIKSEVSRTLLICVKIKDDEKKFIFAYWIPNEFISSNTDLGDTLELFANRFGSKIAIGGEEAYFIREKQLEIKGTPQTAKIMHPVFRMPTLFSDHLIVTSESVDSDIKTISYAFVINDNKYLGWLSNAETIVVKIHPEWSNFLDNIVENISQVDKSGFEFRKETTKAGLKNLSTQVVLDENQLTQNFRYPKLHLHKFNAVLNTIRAQNSTKNILVSFSQNDKTCVFCQKKSGSQEHILPEWFRNYFDEQQFDSITSTSRDNDIFDGLTNGASTGIESSYGITTQIVCVDCNTGWMSKLEVKAKNILTIDESKFKTSCSQLNLDPNSSSNLSLWITIKALLLAKRAWVIKNIPSIIFKKLMAGEVPDGFVIEVLIAPKYILNYSLFQGTPQFLRTNTIDRNIARMITSTFFVSAIQIGNLLFRVSYWEGEHIFKRESLVFRSEVIFPQGLVISPLKSELEGDYEDFSEVTYPVLAVSHLALSEV